MGKERAARRCCNSERAKVHGSVDRQSIARGYLWAAIAYALCFGAILVHWAVVA